MPNTGFIERLKGKITVSDVYQSGLYYESVADNLTAGAGGGQVNAFPITAQINRFTTVASAADSAILPPTTVAGLSITIINAATTNSMQVFGSGTDTINGVAFGTGVALAAGGAAGKTATFFSPSVGAWHMQLSA